MAETNNSEKRPSHFDISASVVKQLGEELVTDEVTALMELVKNSYDADATWVRIEIQTNGWYSIKPQFFDDSKEGYIIIEDNGFGMDETDIRDGWLIISLSAKREMKKSGLTTPLGRTPLGDKGLGRLSTQRLGQRLEMLTLKEGTQTVNHVAFDWSSFTENVSLSSINVYIDKFIDQKAKKGTKLLISNLNDKKIWKGDAADKIKGQLSQLIFPYESNRKFKVYLTINGEKIDFDQLNEDLRDQAASRFTIKYENKELVISGKLKQQKLVGKLDEKIYYDKIIAADRGKNFFTFLTDPTSNKKYYLNNIQYNGEKGWLFSFQIRQKLDEIGNKATVFNVQKEQEEFADPGAFYAEVDDYDLRSTENVESVFDTLSEFRNIVKNQVGIRIFRDGFGIKPFGINGEDWLNLSKGQTSGSSFYGLRPKNVIGFVSISGRDNRLLKEKTDREGFMENAYSKNFFLLMETAVDKINSIIEKTKRSYNEFKKSEAEKSLGIYNLKDVTVNLKKTATSAKKLEEQANQIESRLNNAVREIVSLKSSAGSKVNKSIILQIENLLEENKRLFSSICSIIQDTKRLDEISNYLTPRINDLENQLDEFSELAALGLTAESLSHEISNILDRLVLQTNQVNKEIKNSKNVHPEIFVYIGNVNSIIKSLRKQLSHLAPLLKYVRETKEHLNIQEFASELKNYYEDKFGNKIAFNLDLDKSPFNIVGSKGKLTQIFDNVILNSEYWLKEKAKTEKNFSPIITFQSRKPFVRIFDNGYGIDHNLDNRIFQPFVTGKPKEIGRGLGLFIVQQLLDSIGCDITLLQDKNQYNRKYIFQLNLEALIK